ncbi:hypothetical protein [Tessaracoccus sp. OH4464_COT-324]|uniref:hypothetical protein n=1 Tax=Tessaracoccus sp. OH4464_COT-324 TaxID=2491059 RepID=UPI000F63FB2C|nr:hypothetical protein [Tessaracoccus sp. OH4464_COT-324]RRD46181.1 hypothetical protein EII42_08315 [Tessaracoccus sp. OH4464_COT-324]
MTATTTPAFVVDEAALLGQVHSFKQALADSWPNSVLSYSVKTNSLPWLVAWMGRHGVPAEIVSEEEWDLAVAVGHHPERIVVNGPTKSRRLVDEALDAGAVVNLDSRRELRWVLERAASGRRVDTVGVRVNWNVDGDAPGHTASGAEGLRFGFHVDNGDLDDVLAQLSEAGVRVAGLHLHVTSLTRALDTYVSAARTACRIISRHKLELDWIDLGGGFFGGDSDQFPSPEEYISTIRAELVDHVNPDRTTLIIEPGAALIAVPVEFHTSVIDVKPVQDHTIVVTDGSRTNLDTFFRKSGYEHELLTDGEPTDIPQVISGFTCLDNDRLMTLTDAPALAEGDRVVYHKVGSYTMTFNPLFIQYLPRVYARRTDGRVQLVRERWGVEHYLAGNHYSEEDL